MTSKERARARFLKLAFGITPVEWDRVLAYQNGVCFVCDQPSLKKRLASDHRHHDGLFRGLLCDKCNPLLGKIENAYTRYGLRKVRSLPAILLSLSHYLSRPPAISALGWAHYGYIGRTGTKKFRKWAKRKAEGIRVSGEST